MNAFGFACTSAPNPYRTVGDFSDKLVKARYSLYIYIKSDKCSNYKYPETSKRPGACDVSEV